MKRRTLFITIDMPRDGGSGGQIVSWRALQAHAALASLDLLVLGPSGSRPSPELLDLVDRCEAIEIDSFYFAHAKAHLAATFARSQISRAPYRVLKFASREMCDLIDQWSTGRRYSVVHADHLSTWQYASRVADARRVLLNHHVESQIFETIALTRRQPIRSALLREARRTARYEAEAIAHSHRTLVLSSADRDRLVSGPCAASHGKIAVWPIPVKTLPLLETPQRGRLLVLGSLRSGGRLEGLRWLLHEVWPSVRRRFPNAILDIVGADPPLDISARHGSEGIAVHGYVDDTDSIFRATQACLVPLLWGGGVRVKILELLSCGIPCIGSPLGVQGNGHLSGVHAVSTPAEWLTTIAMAIEEPDRLRREASQGRLRLQETNRLVDAVAQLGQDIYLDAPPADAIGPASSLSAELAHAPLSADGISLSADGI
jgi:glycosyltransferase involved in cell wall biosynthesis